jgi:hypothetical protein
VNVPVVLARAEQIAGIIVVAGVLLDVFLTVLYARMGYSIIADLLAQVVWSSVFHISRAFSKRRPLLLSFGGPLIVVAVLAFWIIALICGVAMIFHPELGTAIRSSSGATPRDFITALYAAGAAMITLGMGTLEPHSPAARLLYVFDPVIGMSLMTLTITYIVEIYNALHDRNTLALKLHLISGKTGNAADLVAALGPGGDFTTSYSMLAEIGAEIISLKESHNFYPVLFYFRFRDALYSVSRASLLALDTATLLSTALNEKRYAWLKSAAALITVRDSAALLINTLEQTFLPKRAAKEAPDEQEMFRWRLRYFAALRRLQDAGIETRTDEQAGAKEYAEMRRKWNPYIRTLAPAMGFGIDEVDPALSKIQLPHRQPEAQPH